MRFIRFLLLPVVILLVIVRGGRCEENPIVVMKTELGDIVFEIYLDKAPVTAANFLRYIDENRIEGATFYRIVTMKNQSDNDVKIEVIQGGLVGGQRDKRLPPIEHETTGITGILHKNGVISMARANPGSASSEFFICVGDQPELDFGGRRNPDGQGFAAFGQVIEGMEVVHQIHRIPADGQYLQERIQIDSVSRRTKESH